MLLKSNLAFSGDPPYNNAVSKPDNTSWTWVLHNKKALIMRENILASGMEVSDIDTAAELSK